VRSVVNPVEWLSRLWPSPPDPRRCSAGGSILLSCHHFLSGALHRTAQKPCRVRAPALQRSQLRQHCFDELRVIRPTKDLERVLSLMYSRLLPVEFLDKLSLHLCDSLVGCYDNCEVYLQARVFLR
jgi:hypothetical protein